jgi:hypothetical protein
VRAAARAHRAGETRIGRGNDHVIEENTARKSDPRKVRSPP